MSDGMGREPAYLSSHATNRYFIPNWGSTSLFANMESKNKQIGEFEARSIWVE